LHRITTAGTITEFTIPTAGSNPEGITALDYIFTVTLRFSPRSGF
jgi:hypothetical protein